LHSGLECAGARQCSISSQARKSGFPDLRFGIDIAEKDDVLREEGLLFPVVSDYQNERRCELVFIKACGGLPALLEAGELAIFALLRVGMEFAFRALRCRDRRKDFGSANADRRPALGMLREAFAIVIGRKNRGDLLGDIVLLQQTAGQYSLGHATGSGDNRVYSNPSKRGNSATIAAIGGGGGNQKPR